MSDMMNTMTEGRDDFPWPRPRARNPRTQRLSLATPLRILLFLGFSLAGCIMSILSLAVGAAQLSPLKIIAGILWPVAGLVLGFIVFRMVHIAAEWERGVVLRLGKFQSIRGPGLVIIFPVIDYLRMVDTRVLTLDIPRQLVITRDNVPVSINGVLYFRVLSVESAVIKVQDYEFAILQYSMSALRDVIGRLSLDDLLFERDQIQKEIEESIEETARSWGLNVEAVRLKDMDMPEELKRMMSRQASAEREKRATITKAEGDRDAAVNLAKAAQLMLKNPGAMQLRTLQTLDGLGGSSSNTVVLALPTDLFALVSKLAMSEAQEQERAFRSERQTDENPGAD